MINGVKIHNNSVNFGNDDKAKMTKGKKAVVALSSMAGMATVLGVVAKKKGFSLSPKKIYDSEIKDWAIFKYEPKDKAIDFGDPRIIIGLASGSVAGGFVGGALVDKKSNFRAKKREVLNQILGNVLVPVGCVYLGSKIYEKYADKLKNMMPAFKNAKGVKKFLNKCSKAVPQIVATFSFLGVGIFCGNRVSNYINEKLYHKKVNRNIKATDFAPHIDDICMATSMMDKTSNFGAKIGLVIPWALTVPGYQVGIAQEQE